MTRSIVCAATVCFSQSRYTGKERDAESGLDYFGARYYASTMGRFSSPDPSGLYYADPTNPQSLNLYSYALNNPLKNTDPTGMYCYYGSTDADVGDDSQYDMHSSQGECTQTDENGNKGQWVDDPHTDVNVSANGDGSMDSYSSSFDGSVVTPYDQHSQWQGDPDDKRIQTLASDINTQVGPLLNLGDAIAGCAANHYVLAPFAAITSLLGAPVPKTAVFGRAAGMGGDASKFMSGASTAEYLARGGASAKFTGAAATASKALTGTARVAGAVGRVAGPVALVLDAALIAKCVSDAGHH